MALADFNHIKAVIAELDIQRPSRFGFTESAVSSTGQAEIDALTGEYIIDDGSQINSIPSAEMVGFDPIIIDIGLRTQAATAPRMALNHFFGRLSLNLLKLTDKLNLLVKDHLVHRYITPSGNVTEHITVSPQTDSVQLIQHQSPLSASEPVTASAAVTILAAVDDGNAGVMTGADKKSLTDLLSRTLTITGVKTFGSIPELPSSDPTTDNQAVRKAFVTAEAARLISETLAAVEERKGFQVFTERQKDIGINYEYIDLNKGILSVSEGLLGVDINVLKIETAPAIVTISSDLTASNWYVVYCDTSGNLTVELLSGATNYNAFPLTELDLACPVESKKVARYKIGDATKRAIAIAYSLPAISAWDSGTTFARGGMCTYNGSAWVSLQGANLNQVPGVATTYWAEMGTPNRLFAPKIYNLPIETFGTGELGDVTLDGTGLGATGTPFYGIEEETASTPEYYSEYQFNNLTLTGACYCGKSNGNALAPVIIRVKGTLTIESGGQLNGDARGANGGAGGGGANAGGAGAKSGRPIFIYANRIINKRNSGYWVTCVAGDASNGATLATGGHGGGGGGGGSSSNLTIITNSSELDISGYNAILQGNGGNGGNGSTGGAVGGGGGGAGGLYEDYITSLSQKTLTAGCANNTPTGFYGGIRYKDGNHNNKNIGGRGYQAANTPSAGVGGACGGGGGGGANGGNGGSGGGGGGGNVSTVGGNAGTSPAGGGGGGGGGGNTGANPGTAGGNPTVPHVGLHNLKVITNYSTRYGI